jgi:hypothetical protein
MTFSNRHQRDPMTVAVGHGDRSPHQERTILGSAKRPCKGAAPFSVIASTSQRLTMKRLVSPRIARARLDYYYYSDDDDDRYYRRPCTSPSPAPGAMGGPRP